MMQISNIILCVRSVINENNYLNKTVIKETKARIKRNVLYFQSMQIKFKLLFIWSIFSLISHFYIPEDWRKDYIKQSDVYPGKQKIPFF